MTKALACWIGRHAWTTRVEQGESYRVCSRCGRSPRRRGTTPVTTSDLEYMKVSGQSDSSINQSF